MQQSTTHALQGSAKTILLSKRIFFGLSFLAMACIMIQDLGVKKGPGEYQYTGQVQNSIPPSVVTEIYSDTTRNESKALTRNEKLGVRQLKTVTAPIRIVKHYNIVASTAAINEDLPALEPGMVNVTSNAKAYHIKIEKTKEPARITVPADLILIPDGYNLLDVFTYRFDSSSMHWVALKRDSIDRVKQIIYSIADKDGDYINAVIKVPESPQVQGYTPTTMSEIKAADPGSQVQVIAPPVASQTGAANLSYTIETPPGRQNIQPKISLGYSSDGANGWLGEGWSIPISTIAIETRWGVPRYKNDIETETYILDGQMLAMVNDAGVATTAHRDNKVNRKANRQFYPRKQSGFERIIRKGNATDNYSWEITGKDGTKYTYGSKSSSQLKSAGGQIAEWKLEKVEDLFGNYMEYHYAAEERFVDAAKTVTGRSIVLDKIEYTKHPFHIQRFYRVEFIRQADCKRTDRQINGRYGFLTYAADLLEEVRVSWVELTGGAGENVEPIRSYKFQYTADKTFGKTLLKSITQVGDKGSDFNTHSFEYLDEIRTGPANTPVPYGNAQNWDLKKDNLKGDLPVLAKNSTAIGGTKSRMAGGSFYIGAGPNDWSLGSKSNTIGGQFGGSVSGNEGVNTLADINGDALPDKVFVEDGIVKYRPNTSVVGAAKVTFGDKIVVKNAPKFYEETGYSFNYGLQSNFFVPINLSKTEGKSTIKSYFSDVNADGLIDIVSRGEVYFNHVVKMADGNWQPVFERNSGNTEAPIFSEAKRDATMYDVDPSEQTRIKNSNPLNEVVRIWEAPFDGDVKITAPVQLIKPVYDPSKLEEQEEFDNRDGVTVSIQHNSVSKWNLPIDKDDFNEKTPNINVFTVKKGHYVIFRLQSGTGELSNGAFDKVTWKPEITYTSYNKNDTRRDVFGKNPYKYTANEDFIVSNRSGIILPVKGKVKVESKAFKPVTSDIIRFRILLIDTSINFPQTIRVAGGRDSIVYEVKDTQEVKSWEFKGNDKVDQELNLSDIETDLGDIICFEILTSSNADMSAVSWKPKVLYNDEKEGEQIIYGAPEYSFLGLGVQTGEYWPVPADQAYTIKPIITFQKENVNGDFQFVVREGEAKLGSQQIAFENSVQKGSNEGIQVNAHKNEHLSISYEGASPAITANYLSARYLLDYMARTNGQVFATKENTQVQPGKPYTIPFTGDYVIEPTLRFKTPINVNVTFEIFGALGATLSSKRLEFKAGVLQPVNLDTLNIKTGTIVTCKFTFATAQETIPLSIASYDVCPLLNADYWIKRDDVRFGPMFRGWGQFIYNGMAGRAGTPINANDLLPKQITKGDVAAIEGATTPQLEKNTPETIGDPVIPGKVSPGDNIYDALNTFSDEKNRFYRGAKADIFVDKEIMSAARLGLNHVVITNPFTEVQAEASGAIGVDKRITNTSRARSAGAFNVSGSFSNGESSMESDFLDLNGDRYPDIVSGKAVQFSNPRGGLNGGVPYAVQIQKSNNHQKGVSFSGSPGGSTSTVSYVRQGGLNSGTGANAGGAATAANDSKLSVGLSIGVEIPLHNDSGDETQNTLMDMNGDGLPDQVAANGNVWLNLGTGFSATAMNWGMDAITEGINPATARLNMGLSFSNGSIVGGAGGSENENFTKKNLVDVNGDGLVDKLRKEGDNIFVGINTGAAFLPEIQWTGITEISKSRSAGHSVNAAYTIGIPLVFPFPVVKLALNPGVFASLGLGRTETQLTDMDGDGVADYITSSQDDALSVKLSSLGATNKLSKVITPLGGSFEMAYRRSRATYEHPGGKWVLAQVEMIDGFKDDGLDPLTLFEYEDGKYDRYEREFLGFGIVTTLEIDRQVNDKEVYRRRSLKFDNDNYYTASNVVSEKIEGAKGVKFSENRYEYYNLEILPNGDSYVAKKAAALKFKDGIFYFPVQSEKKGTWEKKATFHILSEAMFKYTSKRPDNIELTRGDVTEYSYSDKGKLISSAGGDYDYRTTITYQEDITVDHYIVSLPSEVKVTGGDGNLYRHSKAEYWKFGERRTRLKKVSSLSEKGGGFTIETEFDYDQALGLLTKKKLPVNNEKQRMEYSYEYDASMRYFIARVKDSHELSYKINKYNYHFGQPTETQDYNERKTLYQFDEFGRVVTIIGTREDENIKVDPYTLKFVYDHKAANPYAVTTHYDEDNPKAGIQTVQYIDARKRPIQVKKTAVTMQVNQATGVPGAEAEGWIVSGRINYDPMGRVRESYHPKFENDPASLSLFNPGAQGETPVLSDFDPLDRAIKTVLQDKATTSTEYDMAEDGSKRMVMRAVITDANNHKRETYTNGSGLKTAEVQFLNAKRVWTQFDYNPVKELVKVTDATSKFIFYSYDMMGKKVTVDHPDGGVQFFYYDPFGNLYLKKDANGTAISYKYDFDHLTAITYDKEPWNSVQYVYGSASDAAQSVNARGRVIFQSDASGTQQFEYGLMGEVTKNRRSILAPFDTIYSFTTEFKYDSWNRVQEILYPDGEKVSYTYNKAGLLKRIEGEKSVPEKINFVYVSTIGYDRFEKPVYMQYGNGAVNTFGYEKERRRLDGVTGFTGGAEKRQFLNVGYDYDPVSNITTISNKAPLPLQKEKLGGQFSQTFKYDELDRMKYSEGTWTGFGGAVATHKLTMVYDEISRISTRDLELTSREINRTQKATYKYDDGRPHQLVEYKETATRTKTGQTPTYNERYTASNSIAFTYDKNGNDVYRVENDRFQEQTSERKVLWDQENRVSAVSENGYVSSYVYGADGERVIKLSTEGAGAYVNGLESGQSSVPNTFSLYINQYYSVRNGNSVYTKHIYAGSQRIVSKVIDKGNIAKPQYPEVENGRAFCVKEQNQKCIVADAKYYSDKLAVLNEKINSNYDSFQVPHAFIDNKAFQKVSPSLKYPTQDNPADLNQAGIVEDAKVNKLEQLQYFYHGNYLGNTNFISGFDGQIVHYIEYLPYGETFIEQRNNYYSQFLFNAKEQDDETAMYYYGARYFDTRIGQWLGVDPKYDQYLSTSPYVFSQSNPVRFFDFNGMETTDNACSLDEDFMTQEDRNIWYRELRNKFGEEKVVREDTGIEPSYALEEAALFFSGASTVMRGVGALASRQVMKAGVAETAELATVSTMDFVPVAGKTAKEGISVLGKFPDYLNLADKLGARRFSIPQSVWNKMTAAERWVANQKFLDRIIQRGDRILLSNPVTDLNKVSGAFRKELEYLMEKGFRLNSTGTQMIK